MVLLHVKRGEKENEFLYETTVKISCKELLEQLVTLNNLRLKVLRLAKSIKELGKHGPIRPEETRGLSDDTTKYTPLDINAYGKPSNPDEYGYRTGCPPPPEVAAVLERTANEAEAAVAHTLVEQKQCITTKICQEMLDNMRGAVMIAYPAYHRLPAYDPARQELENKEELDGHTENQDVFEVDGCGLWFAGKEIQTTKVLEEYAGKNEKTKVALKMQPKSAGAPVREPRIDAETHKSMLSFYYKKQEESKKLMEDDDDSYLDSAWANNKALKTQLVGGGRPISFR